MSVAPDFPKPAMHQNQARSRTSKSWMPGGRKKPGGPTRMGLALSMAVLANSTLLSFVALAWLASHVATHQGKEASVIANSMGMILLMLVASVAGSLLPQMVKGTMGEAWSRQGRPMAGIAWGLAIGMFSGFLLFVLVWMGSVQAALTSSIQAQQALAREMGNLASEQGWLDAAGAVAPIHRQAWCQSAVPLARLAQTQATAFPEGREVGFLMAASHWDFIHQNGCIPDSKWLAIRQSLYRRAQESPSDSFRLARRLAWLPITRQVLQAKPLMLQQLNPTPALLCTRQIAFGAAKGWVADRCQTRFTAYRFATAEDLQEIRRALAVAP